MPAIFTLAVKDLRLMLRDRLGFFFTFFFPLIYATFFGVLFAGASAGPTAIGVVVVDEDRTPASAELLGRLQKLGSLKVDTAERGAAEELVRRGRRAACMVIRSGFAAAARRVFWGDPMTVELVVDPGQSMTAGLVEGLVTAAVYEQMQKIFTDRETMTASVREARAAVEANEGMPVLQRTLLGDLLNSVEAVGTSMTIGEWSERSSTSTTTTGVSSATESAWRPVRIERRATERPAAAGGGPQLPRSPFAICFPQGIVWGAMACAATFAVSLLTERIRGTLPRLTVAPLARWQVLTGKAGACFVTTVGLIAVLLVVARLGFGVRPDSLSRLAAAVVCVAVAIVGLMMVLSVLGRTEQAVSGISWALIVVMAMLGGGMLPLVFMPAWMQPVSNASLVKWSILALEGAIWRGFTWSEMALPCALLLGVGVGGFAAGTLLFRRATA